MEKIIDVSALTDQLKILLWDRSKSREELAELVLGLIDEAGEELIRCEECFFEDREHRKTFTTRCGLTGRTRSLYGFCHYGVRRDSEA